MVGMFLLFLSYLSSASSREGNATTQGTITVLSGAV